MTGASIHSEISDRTSVSPKTGVRAATASPKAVAAPHSNPTLTGVASVPSATLDPSQPVSAAGSSVADFSFETPASFPSVSSLMPKPAGLASAGSAFSFDAEVDAFMAPFDRAGIRMNAATLATIAASESFSKSTSLVKA